MSPAPASVLVIGGGVAAYTFVEQLRLRGYRGRLGLVTARGLPSDLPPVSKEYLRGVMGREELDFRDRDFYTERDIHVLSGPATSLDLPEDTTAHARLSVHRDNCAQQIELTADLVVLATGARAVTATADGKPTVRRNGITTLRSADDADRVRERLTPGARVVILGAGLIGAEAASAAVEAGAKVVLINRSAPAAASSFGTVAALALEAEHLKHGVRIIETVSVGEDLREDGVVEVRLLTGETLEADVVIDAGGAVPADSLARVAGVAVADDATGGILVDAAGRTSDPRVLAIGDVARHTAADGSPLPWTGHWEAAMHSAEDAAAGLLGQNGEERGLPWFWSDRYGHHLEVVGDPNAGTLTLRRSDERGLRAVFSCLPADDAADAAGASGGPGGGQVVVLGAVTFDDSRLARAARRLANRARPVAAAALEDPAVSARDLLRP